MFRRRDVIFGYGFDVDFFCDGIEVYYMFLIIFIVYVGCGMV